MEKQLFYNRGYALHPITLNRVIDIVSNMNTNDDNNDDDDVVVDESLVGGIAPHDDHLYSATTMMKFFPRFNGKTLILIGVAHGCSIKNALIFDTSSKWKGFGGNDGINLSVDVQFRDFIISKISDLFGRDAAWVSDQIHAREHSLVSFTPWINKFNPNAKIIPILVGNMENFSDHSVFSHEFIKIISTYMKSNDLHFGGGDKGVQILISNDCCHYGDFEWGGSNIAPFGCLPEISHEIAVGRDQLIIKKCLCSSRNNNNNNNNNNRKDNNNNRKDNNNKDYVNRDKIEALYNSLHIGDCQWCGRESVPFGVLVMLEAANLMKKSLKGYFYSYTTSLKDSIKSLFIEKYGEKNKIASQSKDENEKTQYIDSTNINTIHHWVGYTAIGFHFE